MSPGSGLELDLLGSRDTRPLLEYGDDEPQTILREAIPGYSEHPTSSRDTQGQENLTQGHCLHP